jgi:hypothetical protein
MLCAMVLQVSPDRRSDNCGGPGRCRWVTKPRNVLAFQHVLGQTVLLGGLPACFPVDDCSIRTGALSSCRCVHGAPVGGVTIGVGRGQPVRALSPIVGYLDVAEVTGFGVLHVRGWAVTADCPTCAIGIFVRSGTMRLHDEYHLANEPRIDLAPYFLGYGVNHGFDFTISLGRQQSPIFIQAEGLNGGTPLILSGFWGEDSGKWASSYYAGLLPPPGQDQFLEPFLGWHREQPDPDECFRPFI